MQQLATCRWVADHRNVLITGPCESVSHCSSRHVLINLSSFCCWIGRRRKCGAGGLGLTLLDFWSIKIARSNDPGRAFAELLRCQRAVFDEAADGRRADVQGRRGFSQSRLASCGRVRLLGRLRSSACCAANRRDLWVQLLPFPVVLPARLSRDAIALSGICRASARTRSTTSRSCSPNDVGQCTVFLDLELSVVAAVPVDHELECLLGNADDDLVDQSPDNAFARRRCRAWAVPGSLQISAERSAIFRAALRSTEVAGVATSASRSCSSVRTVQQAFIPPPLQFAWRQADCPDRRHHIVDGHALAS